MNSAISNSDPATVPKIDRTLQCLVDYWVQVKGSRPAPTRADLDPAQLQPLLPWIMLMDSLGNDYRFRLVGTGLDGLFGRRLTGEMLRAAWPARLGDQWLVWMNAARSEQMPVVTSATLSTARRPLQLDTVILPLCSRDATIDMLLCAISGSRPRPTQAAVLRSGHETVTDNLITFSGGFLTV